MKGGSWKAFFICLGAIIGVVYLTSFISFSQGMKPCDDSFTAPADPNPIVIPSGNCNCTVSYTGSLFNKLPTPALSCQCKEAATECGPPEVQIVEKEVEQRERCDPAPWHADKEWHYPARFPLCSMDVCFDYSRCENARELLIYSYDKPAPPRRYFSAITESAYFTDDPERACIFFVFLDNETNPHREHPATLPHWNGGLNHVLVTFADKWTQRGPLQESIGNASVMATDMHESTYRAGFDISIPLPGKFHSREMQTTKATERKYLLTFKGKRYLGRSGEGTFRSWESFRTMHNGEDVIVATSCKHMINDMTRAREPELGVHCDEDEVVHGRYNFADLLNATFGLVPAGSGPASYRFIEVLSAGSIPVLIADNYVRPFDTLIQWYKCLLHFPTTEMHRVVGTLRAMKEEEVLKRQENCVAGYNEFLKDDETLLRTSVRALKARFVGVLPGLSEI